MERVSRKEETRYKIVIVGDVHVGKTTLFCKYVEGEDLIGKEPIVTVIDFKRKQIKIDDKDIQLYIWDTAGQEKFRSIVSTYFKGCDGIMLVFDLSDASSFANATSKWY